MRLSGHVTQPHMVATFLMNDISRICRQLVDQHMRQIDLTRAQWYLLNYVHLYDGLSQQELADLVDLGKSNVAKQIRSLEQKGWVKRGPHEQDGRSFRVYMIKKMKPTIKKLNSVAELSLQGVLDHLNKKEISALVHMLKGIDLQLESALADNTPDPEITRLLKEIRKELE